jgi:hypothetical protein
MPKRDAAVKIVLSNYKFYFSFTRREDKYEQITQLWRAANAELPLIAFDTPENQMAVGMCDSILNDHEHFSRDYGMKQAAQMEQWKNYFNTNKVNTPIHNPPVVGSSDLLVTVKTNDLRPLLYAGVPDPFRGKVWHMCSGAMHKAVAHPPDY